MGVKAKLMQGHITASQLQGEVFIAPVDVLFSQELVFQPDIVYVSEPSKVKDKIYGSLDLLVEVVSPSTFKLDLTDKMKLYERHGVKEYWLVFPLEKTIMVKVKSKVLEGFELEVEEVFSL